MRSGEVSAEGGYDGEYGVIKLLDGYGQDKAHGAPQIRLLEVDEAAALHEQAPPLEQAACRGAGSRLGAGRPVCRPVLSQTSTPSPSPNELPRCRRIESSLLCSLHPARTGLPASIQSSARRRCTLPAR